LPQVPQLPVLVSVLVSQPFVRIPSQSSQGAVQPGAHSPATHEVVPWALVHAILHDPHCVVVVSVFVSQPLVETPSQSP
jgi:hypothetical protein